LRPQPPFPGPTPAAAIGAWPTTGSPIKCRATATQRHWQITGNLTLNLRAERSGNGNGRVYTLIVGCTDASGNSSTKTTGVTVPHDQGKKQ